MNHVTHTLSSSDISIFHRKSANLTLSRNADIDCMLVLNFQGFFYSFWVFKNFFNKYDSNFDYFSKNGYYRSSLNKSILK